MINKLKLKIIKILLSMSFISYFKLLLLDILIKSIKFYIIKINTFFLLCHKNINKLNILFYNLKNIPIFLVKLILVVYYFSYLFFLKNKYFYLFIINFFNNNICFLINIKL